MERGIARIAGGGLLLLSILGTIHGGSSYAAADGAPRLLGALPFGNFQDALHMAFGVWGLRAGTSVGGARRFLAVASLAFLGLGLGAFSIYSLLLSLDLVLPENGMTALWGSDVWLHLLLGALLAATWIAAVRERHRSATPPEGDGIPILEWYWPETSRT